MTIAALTLTAIMQRPAPPQPVVPRPAPDFTAPTATGEGKSLSSFKGKWLVLEWWNHECPVVIGHYGSGNMQSVQKKATDMGAQWVAVNSSAVGQQGHVNGAKALEVMKSGKAAAQHVLLDHDGKVGKAFGARTTPHMYVINPEGQIVYEGAIDSGRTADPSDIAKAENFVLKALNEGMAGKPITTPYSRPYGCSVKYGK